MIFPGHIQLFFNRKSNTNVELQPINSKNNISFQLETILGVPSNNLYKSMTDIKDIQIDNDLNFIFTPHGVLQISF